MDYLLHSGRPFFSSLCSSSLTDCCGGAVTQLYLHKRSTSAAGASQNGRASPIESCNKFVQCARTRLPLRVHHTRQWHTKNPRPRPLHSTMHVNARVHIYMNTTEWSPSVWVSGFPAARPPPGVIFSGRVLPAGQTGEQRAGSPSCSHAAFDWCRGLC